jgi:hypothetical protein
VAYTDSTGRILDNRTAVTFRYGRDQQRALSPISPGEAHFALNNQDRALSPENTASPLYGQVVPARPVQISATAAGVSTALFVGQTDDFKLQLSRSERYVTVDCIDALGALRGAQISTGVYQGLRPGEAIAVLLDAAGWSTSLRDLDVGATVMPFWWADGDDAFDALMDLVASEGPPALVTVDPTGRIVFRDRHHRLQRTASTTVQGTWRSSGAEPVFSDPADYNDGWKEVINSVSFQVQQRALSPSLAVVWSQQGLISVASGETLPIVVQGTSPFVGAVTPVQTTAYDLSGNPNGDFIVVSGVVSVALSRAAGASTTILVGAPSGPAVIQDLQLRARSVDTVSTVQVNAEHGGSITQYGRRSLPDGREPKWAGLGDAKAIANIILGQRSQRLPTISVTMKAGNALRLAQQVNRDLSDRVHVVEEHSGLDADCFIEQIAHSIAAGGADHQTTFGLEKVPSQISGVFVLGSGVLGTNRLGRTGLMDPATVFTLGSATNGQLGNDVLAA